MWKNLELNRSLIKYDTGRSVLIAMPHSCEYAGYSFWHPGKLVRDSYRSDMVSIGYTHDFSFRLRKYGKYSSEEILDEITLAGDEMEEILKDYDPHYAEPEEPLIYTPEPLEPENATADESLIDD